MIWACAAMNKMKCLKTATTWGWNATNDGKSNFQLIAIIFDKLPRYWQIRIPHCKLWVFEPPGNQKSDKNPKTKIPNGRVIKWKKQPQTNHQLNLPSWKSINFQGIIAINWKLILNYFLNPSCKKTCPLCDPLGCPYHSCSKKKLQTIAYKS